MVTSDDRTDAQRQTYCYGVVGRDSFLSGWGGAAGGYSRAAWACAPAANITRLEDWIRRRGDMQYVNVVDLRSYRPARGTAHYHIYVCDVEHPSQT